MIDEFIEAARPSWQAEDPLTGAGFADGRTENSMKRIVQRVVVIVGVSGGLITAAVTGANALIAANHCEPVARDHR